MPAPITTRTSSKGVIYTSIGPETSESALICVHGWACRAVDFSYVFDEITKEGVVGRAISINLPGHGGSSTEHYLTASVNSFASAVLDLINELGVSDAVLAGHSMGVRIILEAWQKAHQAGIPTVRGLCFLDGSHYGLRKSLFAFDSGDPRSASLSADEKLEKMSETFTRMFSANTPRDFQTAVIAHIRTIDLSYNENMRKSFIAWDREEMDDVLVAVGKSDLRVLNFQATDVDEDNQRTPLKPGVRSRWMEHVAERVPQVRQVAVMDSGHFPHVDQPELVASELVAFCRQVMFIV